MLSINDVVRLIPANYTNQYKVFNYPQNWEQSILGDNKFACLGGKYKIHHVELAANGYFYRIVPEAVPYSFAISASDLILDKDVENCPFCIGQKVILNLSEEDIKAQNFPVSAPQYSFHDENRVYIITEIINDFYIFIDYSISDGRATPFRWDNFKSVS